MAARLMEPPGWPCPRCGEVFECCSAVGTGATEGGRPQPGSLLMCIECGEIWTLDEELHGRLLTEEEAQTLPPDTIAMLAQVENARQTVIRRDGRSPFK